MVQLLLEKKTNINAVNYKNETPLHLAALMKYVDIIQLLTSEKYAVNPNFQDYLGETPLHIAVKYNHLSVVCKLLALPNIDVYCTNFLSETPLHLGYKKDNMETVRLLLDQI